MEPADQRREHPAGRRGRVQRLGRNGARRPAAGAPPTGDGLRTGLAAAMEPADQRREHGSQNLGHLTCAKS